MSILYSIGYSNREALKLLPSLIERGFWFVDIRMSPNSRFPQFRKSSLIKQYGNQYRHVQALGNVNYGTGKEIELKDAASGLRELADILEHGNAVILCGCKNVCQCHRYQVANLVTQKLPAVTVIEF